MITQQLIDRVLTSGHFAERPPVFVDIGASGSLPPDWRPLAPHSICVAFDADTRDFAVADIVNGEWKRLVKLNRLVAERSAQKVDFFLTASPHCSSVLEPDARALAPWAFSALFNVERTIALAAVSLRETLGDLGLSQIDWFKTDSQGTDLRLLTSLPTSMIDQIIVADFEPGIIDAYKGEDKLHALLAFMDQRPFFVSDMKVIGTQRITGAVRGAFSPAIQQAADRTLKDSPCWAEISYINAFVAGTPRPARDMLVGWVFSSVKGQHGHALAIADRGHSEFNDPLFDECRRESLRLLSEPKRDSFLRRARRGLSVLLGR